MKALGSAQTVLIGLGVVVFGAALPAAQDWERAFRETRRVSAARFTSLPAAVRDYLERRGCRVPQTYAKRTAHNVIRGHFTSAADIDIAVLCSEGASSRILVFGRGSTTDVKELAAADDHTYLQVIGPDDAVGYSRAIGVASMRALRQTAEALDDTKTPRIDHDGIDDAFVGKASHVWYWAGRRWMRLRGSD
jgi:hypothetical protein